MPLTVKRALPCLYHYVDPATIATESITKTPDLTDSTVIRPIKESITVESKGAEAIDLTDPASAQVTALSPAKATPASAPSSASNAVHVQGQGQGQVGSTTKRKRITPTVVGVLGSNTHLLSGNMLTACPTPTSTSTDVSNSGSSSNSSSSSGSGHSNGKEGKEGEEGVGSDGMPMSVPHPSADTSATTIPATTTHSPASHGQIAFPAISLPASNTLKTTGPDGTEIKKVRLTRRRLHHCI